MLRLMVAFSLLFGVSALAQEMVSITGRVEDPSGVPIPGAAVRVVSDGKDIAKTLSEMDGFFVVDFIPVGLVQIHVEITGFLTFSKEVAPAAIDAADGWTVQLDSTPPPVRNKTATGVSGKPVVQAERRLPLFQEADVTDLPALDQFLADSFGDLSGRMTVVPGPENLLVITGNTLSMDSGNLMNPDFIREISSTARLMGFRIQEFNPGEMGRDGFGTGPGDMAGGGPGGGMSFGGMGGRGGGFRQSPISGSLSETYGNSALNARSYSLSGQTLPRPVQIQNDFSATIGGVIPFLNTANTGAGRMPGRGATSRAGWNFTYSGNRNRSARDILTTVPTVFEREGDFSKTYTQALVSDPETGLQKLAFQPVRLFHDPNDPSSRFTNIAVLDPVAEGLLEFIPQATIECEEGVPCVNNYYRGVSLPSSSDQINARVSGLRITSRDTIGINYSMRRGSALNASLFPGLDADNRTFSQNINVSGVHTFHRRLQLNWSFGLNRMQSEVSDSFSSRRNVAGELGITGVSDDAVNWGPPTINFTGYGGLSLAAPAINRNQTVNFSGSLNRTGVRHSIRMGGDMNWTQRNSQRDSNARGSYTFTGFATVLLDEQGRPVSGTGNDLADFLLGLPFSTSRSFVDPDVNPYGSGNYLRSRNLSLYVTDNWRFRSNLTVNYGLRYEYAGPAFEKFDRMVSLDVAPDFSSVAQVFPNQTGPVSGGSFPRSLLQPDRNNFAPRVGIAWRPTPRSRFVVRTGYGIAYDAGSYLSIAGRLVNQSPFAVTQNLASNRADPLTIEVGFPVNPDMTILNTYAIDPHYKPSYVQQWNVDVQTAVARLLTMNIAYTGAKGTGLDILRAPHSGDNTSRFIYQTSGAGSIYHGLNMQFSRRFSRGFNMSSSYTLSRSIDDSLGGGTAVAQNDADLSAERALSNQDQRHSFQINGTYELPIGENRAFFHGASPLLLNLIAGWTLSGNFSMTSGFPLTPRYASGNAGTSGAALYNALRPDVTGLPIALPRGERTTQRFFNTAAFAVPTETYGTAGRNSIPGPGSTQLDMALRKGFRLDESNRRLDVSWQVRNVLNHPNWGGVSTTINALNFGQVTSVRSMRSMTVNLRMRF
jgi:trimeric autotransporter adhesin